MQKLLDKIKIEVSPIVYTRNPIQTSLGKRILRESVKLIEKNGYDEFTFKKLAEKLQTTESSIYRYFENKNRLMLYFFAWYLEVQEYRLVFFTGDVKSNNEKFKRALETFFEAPKSENLNLNFEAGKVWKIVYSESFKACLSREQDIQVRNELLDLFDRTVSRLAALINEINPGIQASEWIAILIIQGINDYKYFNPYFKKRSNPEKEFTSLDFFSSFYFNAISSNKNEKAG